MSQNDMVIADGDGLTVLSDMSAALQALASQSSGTSEPGTTYPGQPWWDTTNNLLKIRNGADNGWVTTASWDGTTWTPYVAGSAIDGNFVDVASATTAEIGAAASRNVRITGTTAITGLGTVAAGTTRHVRFADALTLTHNGTSLILPGGANITTAANDTATFVSLGSGNWLCIAYQKASGLAVSGASSASQAEMEAGSATDKTVTPGRQQFHKSAVKAHVVFAMDGTTEGDALNVSSVTDNGTGRFTVNFTTAFSAATYTAMAIADLGAASNSSILIFIGSRAVGSCAVRTQDGSNADSEGNVTKIHFLAMGDFA